MSPQISRKASQPSPADEIPEVAPIGQGVQTKKRATADSWYWRLGAQWWFFPALYLILCGYIAFGILQITYTDTSWFRGSLQLIPFIAFFMPTGLLFPVLNIIAQSPWGILIYLLPAVVHLLILSGIIVIQVYKYRRKKILRWLVIALLIVIMLSFAGCVGGLTTGRYTSFGPTQF
jgi:hypothetical protein